MIIIRQKEYARVDYAGLTKKAAETLKKERNQLAKELKVGKAKITPRLERQAELRLARAKAGEGFSTSVHKGNPNYTLDQLKNMDIRAAKADSRSAISRNRRSLLDSVTDRKQRFLEKARKSSGVAVV